MKILALLLISAALYAGDGIPLSEFAKQGTVIEAKDGRGKAIEIKGTTKFQARVLGTGRSSPFSTTRCVYFFVRKYHTLKDGSLELLDVQSSTQFEGVVSVGDTLVRPDTIDFSKKFRPIVKTGGDIRTEEYCLAPNHSYPMVIRVFGSALPPDKDDRVKTVISYHAEFGPQDW